MEQDRPAWRSPPAPRGNHAEGRQQGPSRGWPRSRWPMIIPSIAECRAMPKKATLPRGGGAAAAVRGSQRLPVDMVLFFVPGVDQQVMLEKVEEDEGQHDETGCVPFRSTPPAARAGNRRRARPLPSRRPDWPNSAGSRLPGRGPSSSGGRSPLRQFPVKPEHPTIELTSSSPVLAAPQYRDEAVLCASACSNTLSALNLTCVKLR